MQKNRITVKDVAAHAQVSPSTVSRVLTGQSQVDPALAMRVLASAQELGYRANIMARALRTQATGTIGVVVPAINNPYFTAAVEALEAELAASNRTIILCDSRDNYEIEADRIATLIQHMVDGLVVFPVSFEHSRQTLMQYAHHTPIIQFDRFIEVAEVDYVGADNAWAMQLAVEHLYAQGCRSFAYVGAEPTSSTAYERLKGYRDSLLQLNDEQVSARSTEYLGTFTSAHGESAGQEILAAPELPEGIVCGADIIAIPMIATLRDAGVDIPGRTKIVGHDNLAFATATSPKLSSVAQPLAEMAAHAVRLLDSRTAGPRTPARHIEVKPHLIVRGSSKAI